jgi:hypothetical protein
MRALFLSLIIALASGLVPGASARPSASAICDALMNGGSFSRAGRTDLYQGVDGSAEIRGGSVVLKSAGKARRDKDVYIKCWVKAKVRLGARPGFRRGLPTLEIHFLTTNVYLENLHLAWSCLKAAGCVMSHFMEAPFMLNNDTQRSGSFKFSYRFVSDEWKRRCHNDDFRLRINDKLVAHTVVSASWANGVVHV